MEKKVYSVPTVQVVDAVNEFISIGDPTSSEFTEESLLEEEIKEPDSLIEDDTVGVVDGDTTTPTVDVNDLYRKKKFEEEQSARIAYFSDPENQAEIVFQNYIMNHKDIYFSGSQKRTLKREFVRNAKKGKYKHLFKDQLVPMSYEEAKNNFQTLNA